MVDESAYLRASSNLSRRDAPSKQDTPTGSQILDSHQKMLIQARVETLEAHFDAFISSPHYHSSFICGRYFDFRWLIHWELSSHQQLSFIYGDISSLQMVHLGASPRKSLSHVSTAIAPTPASKYLNPLPLSS